MANLDSKQARWAELCELYSKIREKGGDDFFRMGRLATHLRKNIAASCGCDVDYVSHYNFEHGQIPQYDRCEKAKSGWDSVSQSETGWVFAFGVLLEISRDTHPKTIMTFPVEVEIHENHFMITAPLLSGSHKIRTDAGNYSNDLDGIGEMIFQGLRKYLGNTNEKPTGIGFLASVE